MKGSEESIKRIAKGAIIILIGSFISKILTYLFRLVIARLGAEDYGLLTLAMNLTVFIAAIITLGLDHGIYRYAAYYKEKRELGKVKGIILNSIKLSMVLSIIVSAILFISADWIILKLFPNFNQDILSTIFRVMVLTIPFLNILKLFNVSFKSLQKPQYEVYTKNLTEPLLKFVLALILVSLGLGVFSLSFIYLGVSIVSSILGWFLLRNLLSKVVGKVKSISVTKELLKYSIPLISVNICFSILTSIDMFMLGYFKTATVVGIYNAVAPTAQLMNFLSFAVMTLFLPVIMHLHIQKNKKAIKTVYQAITKWLFLMTFMVVGLFTIYSKEVLTILFGLEFSSGWLALIILLFGYCICFTLYPSQNLL